MSTPLRKLIGALAAATLLAGAASATVVAYDTVTLDVPDCWTRLDERGMASFASADGGLTLTVLTRRGDDDPDDVLDAFVEAAEAGETAGERSEPEEVREDPFELWRQETATATADGRAYRRIYVAAAAGGSATVAVLSGEQAAWALNGTEGRRILDSLFVAPPDVAPPSAPPVEPLPGDGGLEGVHAASTRRSYLAWPALAWTEAERLDLLLFDPLGEVYRGAPPRFDASAFERCGGPDAWRCGRYRIEGGEIALRWGDGTSERRAFAREADGLRIGGRLYASAPPRAPAPEGRYEARDLFNAGLGSAGALRFLEDGQIALEGFRTFKDAAESGFRSGLSAGGRFKLAGAEITVVYASGGSEVLGFARLPGEDGERLLIGGMVFERR